MHILTYLYTIWDSHDSQTKEPNQKIDTDINKLYKYTVQKIDTDINKLYKYPSQNQNKTIINIARFYSSILSVKYQ